jgi:hypothetical protein
MARISASQQPAAGRSGEGAAAAAAQASQQQGLFVGQLALPPISAIAGHTPHIHMPPTREYRTGACAGLIALAAGGLGGGPGGDIVPVRKQATRARGH